MNSNISTPAFSRLQLAAALLEYDNDDTDPSKPHRSAHDSAIFAHLRRHNAARSQAVRGFDEASRRSTDFLGVKLPSEAGEPARHSVAETRRSRATSVDMLRNPFGEDPWIEDDEMEEPGVEVDLTSWGLGNLVAAKDKEQEAGRKRAKSDAVLPNPHQRTTADTPIHQTRPRVSRSGSGSFGVGGAFLDAELEMEPESVRRRSISSAMELGRSHSPHRPPMRNRHSMHTAIELLPVTPPLLTGQDDRVAFPMATDVAVDSELQPTSRRRSTSLGTMMLDEEPNPFAVQPPSPSRQSRFDPKAVAHARTMSNATRPLEEEGGQSIRAPSPAPSRLDPRNQRQSTVSMGANTLFDNDARSLMTVEPKQPHHYTRMELMRPKVLIMPSPLQTPPEEPEPEQDKAGFHHSTMGRPFPKGARTSRPMSQVISNLEPGMTASNSFNVNPRTSMTLSQLTFRNNLKVGGERDVAYHDLDGRLERAQTEGEQVQLAVDEDDYEYPVDLSEMPVGTHRPAGKLYGKSLIDDLEARKAELHSKRRVFTGDHRPAMMERASAKRSSTFIDPDSLQRLPFQRSTSAPSQPALGGRSSTFNAPLLNFDGNNLAPGSNIPKTKSVFGVDTFWEREMQKLHEMEAKEKVAPGPSDNTPNDNTNGDAPGAIGKNAPQSPPETHIQGQANPPIKRKKDAIPSSALPEGESDDESEDSRDGSGQPKGTTSVADVPPSSTPDWFAGASDEEDAGPIRTTGTGPRYPPKGPQNRVPPLRADGSDSEEDVPLASTVSRALARTTFLQAASGIPHHDDDDEDEDRPLSHLMARSTLAVPSGANDDDDEEPLGVRASRLIPGPISQHSISLADDDDLPLGMHSEQQRRTQFMMAQQQQQQMLMMQSQMQMQMQMQHSMMFGMGTPSIMGAGLYPGGFPTPPIAMTPAPAPEDAALGRINRWRLDVAVEGQE